MVPSRPRRIVLYTAMLNDQASVWIRIIAPIRRAGWHLSYGATADLRPDELDGTDLVIMHREYPGFYSNWRSVIDLANKRGIPVVYDIDDLLIEMPAAHIDFPFCRNFQEPIVDAMRRADAITVSTATLMEQVSHFGRCIRVIPNYLDDSIWPRRSQELAWDRLTIGYAATSTHRLDLDMLGDCLERVRQQYQHRIQFAFWGITPPPQLRGKSNVRWQPLNLARYPEYAKFMSKQQWDIGIAPLQANLFNKCKSAIKYLENGWLKVPTVYSELPPYQLSVQHGRNALLANSSDAWFVALSNLIDSAELRQSLSAVAHKDVSENHLLSGKVTAITQVWTELVSRSVS